MPAYFYECPSCANTEERIYKMLDDKPMKIPCKKCEGELVRQFNIPAISFGCSGFYSTDKVLSEPEDPLDIDD